MTGHGTPDKPLRISEVDFDARPESFPGLVLSGNPRARGITYGRVFADKIRANICRHFDHPDLPSFEACRHLIRDVYIPALSENWTRGWNELFGIAEGCGMDVDHVVYLNVRDDLAAIRHILEPDKFQQQSFIPLPPQYAIQSASAFFSQHKTDDRVPILAHSWSEKKRIHDDDNFMVLLDIQYQPHEDVANMVILVEAGMISGSGMNSQGIAVVGNALFSAADHMKLASRTNYFPVTCLERYLLEFGTVNDIENICLDIERHASRHIIIANREGESASVELGPEHLFSHHGEFGSEVKLHTNHFHSWEYWRQRREIWCRNRGKASPFRLHRLGQLVEQRFDTGFTAQQIKDIFSDHEGGADAVCQHGDDDDNKSHDNNTVALVMYDTKRQVVSVCKGPPCRGTMMHFAVRESDVPIPDPGFGLRDIPVAPMFDSEIQNMLRGMREVDVNMELQAQYAAFKRQLNNTPESTDSKRRRLNNSPVSDVARDGI